MPPCKTEFLWFQMSQLCTIKDSSSSLDNLSIRFTNKWLKLVCPHTLFCNLPLLTTQTSLATPHSHKACSPDSGPWLQRSHTLSCVILLRTRFSFVGRILWHALHPNNLILFGNRNFHNLVHINPLFCPSKLPSIPFISLASNPTI